MWSRLISQLCTLTVVAACTLPSLTWAQFDDASDLVLSPQDTQRLRDIVNTAVDPNGLTMRQVDLYREKLAAATLLGDKESIDKIMHAWLAVESNGDAKWKSINWHWNNGRRDDAYRTANELIQDRKWPPDNVRLRTQLALLKIQENDLKAAAEQIEKSETQIKYDFGQVIRRGPPPSGLPGPNLSFTWSSLS